MKKPLVFVIAAFALARAGAVELTVYNQNLGLVAEKRTLPLKRGENEISLSNVAAQIDPGSVRFQSLTDPKGTVVREQDFLYDAGDRQRLLAKYIGKTVELERPAGEKRETVSATLLSVSGEERVLQIGRKIHVNPPGTIILPEAPAGFAPRPTLRWRVAAEKAGDHETELSYLTGGLSWRADYAATVSAKEDRMDWDGWATITNDSGLGYENATTTLVAGDVSRVPEPALDRRFGGVAYAMKSEAANIAPRNLFEYKAYDLPFPVTLGDHQSKQVSLISAGGAPVRKRYVYDASASRPVPIFNEYTRVDPNFGMNLEKKVFATFEFRNARDAGLGMPLPAGRVRIYARDPDGGVRFIGEDSMDHTAKDEKVRLRVGAAFDISAERGRTDFAVDNARRSLQETFEIVLRNHKEESVTVTVSEGLDRWSDWKIVDASHKWTKRDANTIEFETAVPKDGQTTVRYAVKYAW